MTQIFSDTDRTLHEVHRQVGRRYGTRFRKEISVGGVDDLTCELTPCCVEKCVLIIQKVGSCVAKALVINAIMVGGGKCLGCRR